MGFMTRLATLLKADAHGMVDALEDKALMLRQHVREAGDELARKRAAVEMLEVEEKGLKSEARDLGDRKKKLDDDVTLALREDEEDLARFAVAKILPLTRRIQGIERRLEALGGERAELSDELARQEAEFERLENQARAYLVSLGQASLGRDGLGQTDTDTAWWEPVADEEIEIELLRRRQAPASGEADAAMGGA